MALADPVRSFNLPSRTARNTAGIVFLLVLIIGAVSVVWGGLTGRVSLDASSWARAELVQGETARNLAAELATAPFPVMLADAERAASWLVAGSLGPRVRQGCDQWLFLADELAVHAGAQTDFHARLDAVGHVRNQLARQGIELIVATVPDKSRVQHEQLCHVYRPESFAGRLRAWEAGLLERGVRYAALSGALEAVQQKTDVSPFLRTDTHWSTQGAHAAAEAIAAQVRQAGVALTPLRHYVWSEGELQPQGGDLIRLAGINWLPMALQPKPDEVAEMVFSLGDTAAPEASADDDGADLFGDINLPSVALVGTSYSGASFFVPFLEAALETPVPSFAQDGGDFWGSIQTYLTGTDFRDAPPRVIIWEIPERVLQMPIGAVEQAWIQGLQSKRSDTMHSVKAFSR